MIAWRSFARPSILASSPLPEHRCSCVMSEENLPIPDCVAAENETFCRCVVQNGGNEEQVGR